MAEKKETKLTANDARAITNSYKDRLLAETIEDLNHAISVYSELGENIASNEVEGTKNKEIENFVETGVRKEFENRGFVIERYAGGRGQMLLVVRW